MPFELLQKPIDIPKCVYHLHNPFAKAYIRAKLMIFSEKRCPTPQSITQPHQKNVIFFSTVAYSDTSLNFMLHQQRIQIFHSLSHDLIACSGNFYG